MAENVSSISVLALPELRLFEHTYSEFVYPKHFHETYVIEVVQAGNESFYCNGTNYPNIQKDALILINPGEVHTGGEGSTIPNAKLICRVFYPGINAWDDILGETSDIMPKLSPVRFRSPIVFDKQIVANIKRIFSLSDAADNQLLQKELYHSVMYDLLTRHMSSNISFEENYSMYSSAIERAREYINDNLTEKLVLEDIAKAAFISPFHFLRLFKKISGITVHQYVISLRIERAKGLLLNKKSIAETFTKLGFLNQVHFTRVFRKTTGHTPKQFRQILGV